MNRFVHWLQTNPIVLVVMFALSFLSAVAGLTLGWNQLYKDYLSKSVEIPVWLLLLGIALLLTLFALARGRSIESKPVELKKIEGKQFGVQRVVIDGLRFDRCEFHGTEIVFRAERGFGFENCKFVGHRFTFGGPAALMIQALTAWYKPESGFRPFVEQLIIDIRGGRVPKSVPPAEL